MLPFSFPAWCFFCVVGYPPNWGKRPRYIDRIDSMVFSPVSIPCYTSRLPSSVPAVSVPFAVFVVCFHILPLFRVLSSCVDPSLLFCFFHCLEVLVGPFLSAYPRLVLGFPLASRRGCPFGQVHGSSLHFPCFLFQGFHALPSSLVGLVPLFLLQAVVFHLSAFFSVGAPIFFLLGPLSGSFSSHSSGSSLGQLYPSIRVLAGVSYVGFL